MSVPEVAPSGMPPLPPKRGLGGCAMVFLVLIGVVLLLPGLCSLVSMGFFGAGDGALVLIYLVTFAIAAGGIVLIRYAIRNR
jgi:hypothetical protein